MQLREHKKTPPIYTLFFELLKRSVLNYTEFLKLNDIVNLNNIPFILFPKLWSNNFPACICIGCRCCYWETEYSTYSPSNVFVMNKSAFFFQYFWIKTSTNHKKHSGARKCMRSLCCIWYMWRLISYLNADYIFTIMHTYDSMNILNNHGIEQNYKLHQNSWVESKLDKRLQEFVCGVTLNRMNIIVYLWNRFDEQLLQNQSTLPYYVDG